MAASAELKTAIGRASVLKRHHPDSPAATDAARDLAALRIAEFAKEIVDQAPPLTQLQVASITALLSGGAR